ncbi:hypothetical protein ABIB66_007532 [Bradyrhizobium sp. F1.13.3]
MNRWAAIGAEGTEHAAVARERLQALAAAFAVIEELAGVGRHDLGSSVTALGTRDRGVHGHLPSGAWQAPNKELPASLLQIGRQFYLLSQNEDFGIFLLDLWGDAKCFKLMGGQFEDRGNMRTLDGVHGNQSAVEKNGTRPYSELRCGVARNKQPTLLSFVFLINSQRSAA